MSPLDSYVPEFPSNYPAGNKIKDFVAKFYAISDDPSKNEEWVDYFLPDATVIMGEKSATGTEDIRRFRQGMWEVVATRNHAVTKAFPGAFGGGIAGDNNDQADRIEYMLVGTLNLLLKTHERQDISWAGHAVLREVDGKLKYEYYRVYMHKG
ncbi:hypothetical protein M426DRAFT_316967 [Hypoxylon sp. CI-4A]|nr:hypothetical protein M426DRAFT_316967 [Hypoxylon sp. CI-4A]